MPKQFEHDISESIAALKEALGVEDGMFSGGRIENFRKGWAVDILGGTQKAHYWTRTDIVTVVSRCGIVKSAEWQSPNGKQPRLHGAGDHPYCKRCDR